MFNRDIDRYNYEGRLRILRNRLRMINFCVGNTVKKLLNYKIQC